MWAKELIAAPISHKWINENKFNVKVKNACVNLTAKNHTTQSEQDFRLATAGASRVIINSPRRPPLIALMPGAIVILGNAMGRASESSCIVGAIYFRNSDNEMIRSSYQLSRALCIVTKNQTSTVLDHFLVRPIPKPTKMTSQSPNQPPPLIPLPNPQTITAQHLSTIKQITDSHRSPIRPAIPHRYSSAPSDPKAHWKLYNL